MRQSLAYEILSYLNHYLSGRIPLDLFEEWFVVNSWNVHETQDAEAVELTFAIELLLAEFSNGDLSEDTLRTRLRILMAKHSTSVSQQQGISVNLNQDAVTSTTVTFIEAHVLYETSGSLQKTAGLHRDISSPYQPLSTQSIPETVSVSH